MRSVCLSKCAAFYAIAQGTGAVRYNAPYRLALMSSTEMAGNANMESEVLQRRFSEALDAMEAAAKTEHLDVPAFINRHQQTRADVFAQNR